VLAPQGPLKRWPIGTRPSAARAFTVLPEEGMTRMTNCEYVVDEHECGHPASVRVVRAANNVDAHSLAVCVLHAPDMFPIAAWEPVR